MRAFDFDHRREPDQTAERQSPGDAARGGDERPSLLAWHESELAFDGEDGFQAPFDEAGSGQTEVPGKRV